MSELVKAARKYLGVKFVHQGRSSHGLDCVGLIWIAYRECGVLLDRHRAYPRQPDHEEMARRISAELGAPIVTNQMRVGDVALIRLPNEKFSHHIGILGDYPYGGELSLIHASGEVRNAGNNPGRVVEHRLSPDLRSRITHVFRRAV